MSFSKPADGVTFAEDELENAFNSLNEEDWLKKATVGWWTTRGPTSPLS